MEFIGPSGAPSTDMIEHIYECVKKGKVYQLTGKGALGRFKAPENFVDGDTFTVNGAAATAYMGSDVVDELAKGRWYRFVLDTENGGQVLNFKSGRVKVSYTVNHNKQKINGEGYTQDATQSFVGVKGKYVTPAVVSYVGFTAPDTQTVRLARGVIINYNYARNKYEWTAHHYTMNLDGRNFSLNSNTSGTAYYEASVSPDVKSIAGFSSPEKSSLTIGTGNNEKSYYYSRNKYTVTCIDKCGGSELGRSSWSAYYGATVSGTDKGTNTATGAYYGNYGYSSSSSATVGTAGATVYRYFEQRVFNLSRNFTQWGDYYYYGNGNQSYGSFVENKSDCTNIWIVCRQETRDTKFGAYMPINVSNYSKITFKFAAITDNSNTANFYWAVHAPNADPYTNGVWWWTSYVSSADNAQSLTVDVSAYSGTRYFFFAATGVSYSQTWGRYTLVGITAYK